MEISTVRNQLNRAIETARHRNQRRRELTLEAERGFQLFLEKVATPVTKMVANALKSEGHQFMAFTPGSGLRLASETRRDDYIEFALDTGAEPPQVIGRISQTRGSRTLSDERPVKAGAAPEAITEEDVLTFLLDALEPWLEGRGRP